MFDCCEGHVTKVMLYVYAPNKNDSLKLIGVIRPDDYDSAIDELESGCCPICDGWHFDVKR